MLPNYFWHQFIDTRTIYRCLDYHVSAPISAFSGKTELELQHLEKTALRHSLQGGRDSPHWVSEQGAFSLVSYFLISCFSCSTGRCRMRSLARQRLAFINVSEKLLYCWRKLFLFKTNGRWYQCDVICVSNVIPRWSQCAQRAWEETARRNNGEGGFLLYSDWAKITRENHQTNNGHLMPHRVHDRHDHAQHHH